MSKKFHSSSPAFTLIELLIVIVVIAILAAISIVMYNGIQTQAAETTLKSSLRQAATQLGIDQTNTETYPLTKEAANDNKGLTADASVRFEYTSNGTTYCLTATSTRTGIKAFHLQDGGPITEGPCEGHAGESGGGSGTTYTFNYANRDDLIGAGWSFMATSPGGGGRDTEADGDLTYDSTGLEIVANQYSIYGNTNSTSNMIFRTLPADWTAAELALEFTPLGNHDTAGIVIYTDDNNYIQFTKSFTAGSTPIAYMYREQSGSVYDELYPSYAPSNIILRVEKSGDTYTGRVSSNNGSTWTTIHSVTQTLSSPRFGIYVGASDHGSPHAVAKIKRVSFE